MARLNEISQPAGESVDALKRRFVRQNRELAKVNSTQSVRIRNLESELSNALSENVALRGQMIKLHCELENGMDRSEFERIDGVRCKLEAKLLEMRGLVDELAKKHESAVCTEPRTDHSKSRVSLWRSPNERKCNTDVSGENDGRLPPILEDKHFPRKSLEAQDPLTIFTRSRDTIDSPDLGPPPVAHFEEGDPINFDAKHIQIEDSREVEELQQILSANLETRRRRRENPCHKELNRKEDDTGLQKQDTALDNSSGQTLRLGAKRKISVRNDDRVSIAEPSEDGCHLHCVDIRSETDSIRKWKAPIGYGGDNSRAGKAQNQDAAITIDGSTGCDQAKKAGSNITVGGRRPLESKSVNSSTQSPTKDTGKKAKAIKMDPKFDATKRGGERKGTTGLLTSSKRKGPSSESLASASDKQYTTSFSNQPETPMLSELGILSPSSSKSSERTKSCDTPPPPILSLGTSNDSLGRVSRRPRGSINYAQPNLRDKMRRPTRDMIDAVGGDTRQTDDYRQNESTAIKQEEDKDALPTWKTKSFEGGTEQENHREKKSSKNPGGNEASPSLGHSSASTKSYEKKGVSTVSRYMAGRDTKESMPGRASPLAALTSDDHRTWKTQENDPPELSQEDLVNGDTTQDAKVNVFACSSHNEILGEEPEISGEKGRARSVRYSRRHSTIAASSSHAKGSLSISRDQAETSRTGPTTCGERKSKDKDSAHGVNGVKSITTLASELEETSLGRGERVANRRRSMML